MSPAHVYCLVCTVSFHLNVQSYPCSELWALVVCICLKGIFSLPIRKYRKSYCITPSVGTCVEVSVGIGVGGDCGIGGGVNKNV